MKITLENVTKRFGNTTAVDNLSTTLESGKLIVSTTYCAEQPERRNIFNDLFNGILKNAKNAARVSVRQQNDSKNEKYHANSWMLRLGFGGKRYKELRRVLMPSAWVRRSSFALTMLTRLRSVLGVCSPRPTWI